MSTCSFLELKVGLLGPWPKAVFIRCLPAQVLRYCHTCPRVIEALMNSYDHVRVSEEWAEAVPAEVVQVRECVLEHVQPGHRGGVPEEGVGG